MIPPWSRERLRSAMNPHDNRYYIRGEKSIVSHTTHIIINAKPDNKAIPITWLGEVDS